MSSPSAILRYALGVLLLLPLGWTASSCLERKNDLSASAGQDRCASCHGDPMRPGDYLLRSAPPSDLAGGEDPSFPGVGAHQIHLNASSTHGAVACSECHVVPERSDAPGHADHGSPATLVFGALASENGSSPSYDTATRRCNNSYCHGASSANAVWSAPRSSAQACGSCHGLPPPLPHPQSDRCSVCHAAVVDSERHFVAPELHVNGHVDYTPGACTACHGSGQDPAPPLDTQGNSSPSALGVGAHQAHLKSSLGRSLACNECHLVPSKVEDPDHIIGLPARVQLLGVAATAGKNPVWQAASQSCADTFCHSPTPGSSRSSPSWTDSSSLGCTSCHGAPPPAPHPQMAECSLCHAQTVGADNHTIIDLAHHVDGIVEVDVPTKCTACHGGDNPAPPTDLEGNTLTSAAGVGAHQTHVRGTARSRAVPCAECHLVPKTVLDPGHLDSARPAEVTFSGAAIAFGATPTYANGTCQNTACHGAQFPNGHASGGAHTVPTWTRVNGTEAACGSCHGLPPPPPHPLGSLNPTCNACHKNIAADNRTFLRPDLHADGIVTFDVP
jgi:predicted CxxxxCH...CXXCH cytochrome family protein